MRIKEQETHLTLQEHDDDDDDYQKTALLSELMEGLWKVNVGFDCNVCLGCEFQSWIGRNLYFLITKTSREKMYCDGSENICKCLNSCRHVSRLPELVIILIILF